MISNAIVILTVSVATTSSASTQLLLSNANKSPSSPSPLRRGHLPYRPASSPSLTPKMATATKDYEITPTPFPARTSTTTISNLPTTATSTYFTDKIFITITQSGRLAHWIHVPLDISVTDAGMSSNPYLDRDEDDPPSDLLPNHQLTATTILGGTVEEVGVLGQTLATQIASAIKMRDSRESRTVVVGAGLDKSMSGREAFSELVGLVLEVI
jgi:proteasome assembly chaperone 3